MQITNVKKVTTRAPRDGIYLLCINVNGTEPATLNRMIARFIRSKAKRTARRLVSTRANIFRNASEEASKIANFGLPDSFKAWLSDSSAKEINEFYRA